MGPVVYALFTYALTAVISFIVVGVIVMIDRMMGKNQQEEEK